MKTTEEQDYWEEYSIIHENRNAPKNVLKGKLAAFEKRIAESNCGK